MAAVQSDEQGLHFSGPITLADLAQLDRQTRRLIEQHTAPQLRADLSRVERLDTAGAVFFRRLPTLASHYRKSLDLAELPAALAPFYEYINEASPPDEISTKPTPPFLEHFGAQIDRHLRRLIHLLFLMSDLTWVAGTSLFRRSGLRPGSFLEQTILIGTGSVPIIALILSLIGAVSTLQASAQLRQFGADIFVADLLAIGICREIGPLMTAIILAGRSGSSIAAEIATMNFSEELDALQSMALNPLRFVAVPKLWAMVLSMPLLTVLADFFGLLGGTIVGFVSLDIPLGAFVDQAIAALDRTDVVSGLVKSVSFAWAITVIAVFHGLEFSGGAAGVGRSTTAAVVSSILGIILLDSFWGLVFYLD